MDLQADISRIKELLDKANEVLIVTHERPNFDSLGSSLALYLGLVGLGKRVIVACPDEMTVAFSGFIGVNKIIRQLSKKNFIISLDYVEGSIEKVSYNIEGDKFNLVIEPRSGFPSFSPDKVRYSYSRSRVDLIFAVDTIHLGGLKKLYEDEKELFSDKPLINIDRHANNSRFGTINLLDLEAASTAEIVGQLLSDLGVKLTRDMATNLLNALYSATDSFESPQVTARAFELAASCLRSGGCRFGQLVSEEISKEEKVVPAQSKKPTSAGEAPEEWLKPKIFKSSSLV
ncbi:MAG: DHH family phosphoesterase [Patescibacteria group bacterium]